MPRTASMAAAAGCGLIAAPLFVSPSPAQPPVARLSGSHAGTAPGNEASSVLSRVIGNPLPALGLGAVAALAASSTRSRKGAPAVIRKAFNPETELGVQAPVGFWDPAGFCADGNEDNFKRRRNVEIKHGRVSMLATIGYIVPEYFRFPGYLSPSEDIKFTDVPNGLGALSKVPAVGWAQIFLFAGFVELNGLRRQREAGGEPGNYGLGFLGACGLLGSIQDPAVRAQKLNAEIANGRLAMFAIIALLFQNGVTGTAGPEMYGFGENSAVIYTKVLFPALAAFGIMGETFRAGPDEKFLKFFPRSDYFGKGKGKRV